MQGMYHELILFVNKHLFLNQGDSGGPLTRVNKDGAHVLVGIVSEKLGESCDEQEYAVFTNVSALLPWIESSIRDKGGMASCTSIFSALPTLGILLLIFVRIHFSHCIQNGLISI